jgi:hypothetical protein
VDGQPGFSTQHVITFKVRLSPSMTKTASSTRAAYQQLTEQIRQIPGAESADLTALLLLSPGDNSPFWFGSHQPASMAARIVGVVGHVEQYGIDGSGGEKPQIYYPLYQLPDEALPIFRDEVKFAVRTGLTPAAIMPAIKKAAYGVGADQPVYNITTMRDLVSGSMGHQRFSMILLVAFAAFVVSLPS